MAKTQNYKKRKIMGRQETHDHKKEKNTKPHKKTRALSPQVLLLARYLSPAASLKYSCNYDHVSTGKYKMSNINMHFLLKVPVSFHP